MFTCLTQNTEQYVPTMFFRLDFINIIIGFFASVVVFARGGELAATAAAALQPAQLLLLTGNNNNFSTIGHHHRSLLQQQQQQSTEEMCLRVEQDFKNGPDYVNCECDGDGETNKGTCTLIFPEVCEEKACVGNNNINNYYTKEEGQYRCMDASATSVKPCVVTKIKIFGILDQSGWKETNRIRQSFVTSGVQNIQLYGESYSYNTANRYPVECGVSYDGVACQTCQLCDSIPSSNGNGLPEFPWTVDCSNIDDYFVPFTCILHQNDKVNDDIMILNASVTNELPLDFTVPSSYSSSDESFNFNPGRRTDFPKPSSYSSSGRPSSFGTVVFAFVYAAAATTTVAVVLPFFGVE